MSQVEELHNDLDEILCSGVSDAMYLKEIRTRIDALIQAVRAEERSRKRELDELFGVLVHTTQDHEKAKALLEEYTQAVIDNFRAKGLTCPWCESRIDEWPLPT